jgi:hypothetical protein
MRMINNIVYQHPVALICHFLLSIRRQYAKIITVQCPSTLDQHTIIRCGTVSLCY